MHREVSKHNLYIDFKKAFDSVRGEVLCDAVLMIHPRKLKNIYKKSNAITANPLTAASGAVTI